jgi:hypothetical protein
MQTIFKTFPLTLKDWCIVIGAGGTLFAIEETRKALFPKLFSRGKWQVGKKA